MWSRCRKRRSWPSCCSFFFFNDTATTEIYTLSLHGRSSDLADHRSAGVFLRRRRLLQGHAPGPRPADRKSTRLNSSHLVISYAVFCLKKKNTRSFTRTTILSPQTSLASPHHQGANSAEPGVY